MSRNLILVANASRARILKTDRAMKDIVVLEELEHPESRAHDADLTSDRAGRIQKTGATRSAYEAHTSAHDVEVDAFARLLARKLGDHVREYPLLPVLVVAPPMMLGRLRALLDEGVRKNVMLEISHDYTGMPHKDLLDTLRAQV